MLENIIQQTNNLEWQISLGLVPGFRRFELAGKKESISTTVFDDIGQGIPAVYDFPDGEPLELFAADAADDASGTGVQEVHVEYLDANFQEQTFVTPTVGGGAVDLTSIPIHRSPWIHTSKLGSGANQSAVGNIDLRKKTGGNIVNRIAAGGNQSENSIFTIPAEHIGVIRSRDLSGLKQEVDLKLRATCERGTRILMPGIFLFQAAFSLNDSTLASNPGGGLVFPPLCDTKISGKAKAAGANVSINYPIYLIEKSAIPKSSWVGLQ